MHEKRSDWHVSTIDDQSSIAQSRAKIPGTTTWVRCSPPEDTNSNASLRALPTVGIEKYDDTRAPENHSDERQSNPMKLLSANGIVEVRSGKEQKS